MQPLESQESIFFRNSKVFKIQIICDQDIEQIPSVSNILLYSEGTFSKTKVELQNFKQVLTS